MARSFGYGRYYGRCYGGFYGKSFAFNPDFDNCCLEILVDGTACAFIDGAATSNVFVNTKPSNTISCDKIDIELDDANHRIIFYFNDVAKGYIDSTGYHDGAP